MSSGISIRALNGADAASFQHLRLQALQESPPAFGSSYEEESDTPISEIARRLKPDPNVSWVLGAFRNGTELIATIGFARERGPKHRHKAHCWGFYVRPADRGKRIGCQLVDEFLSRARNVEGLRMIMLCVNPVQTGAVQLYVKAGFQRYGCEPGALKVGDTYYDVDHMFLRLTPG